MPPCKFQTFSFLPLLHSLILSSRYQSSTSFLLYIVQVILIHLIWILQPLQFSQLSFLWSFFSTLPYKISRLYTFPLRSKSAGRSQFLYTNDFITNIISFLHLVLLLTSFSSSLLPLLLSYTLSLAILVHHLIFSSIIILFILATLLSSPVYSSSFILILFAFLPFPSLPFLYFFLVLTLIFFLSSYSFFPIFLTFLVFILYFILKEQIMVM